MPGLPLVLIGSLVTYVMSILINWLMNATDTFTDISFNIFFARQTNNIISVDRMLWRITLTSRSLRVILLTTSLTLRKYFDISFIYFLRNFEDYVLLPLPMLVGLWNCNFPHHCPTLTCIFTGPHMHRAAQDVN